MRLRGLVVPLIAALNVFAVAPTHAETTSIVRIKDWQAFGGTTEKGRPVCGVSIDVGGKYFGVKYFAGTDTAVVQMGGKTLKIAKDAQQAVKFRIDSHDGWKATGLGIIFNDGEPGIEFRIKKDELDQFVEQLQSGSGLIVSLISSANDDWEFDLTGTRSVHSAIGRCINDLPSSWQKK